MKILVATAALITAAATFSATPALASGLSGTWQGSGYIRPRGRDRERVRCVAQYSRETDSVYRVFATCATSAGSLNQSGVVSRVRQNVYVGDFYNAQYGIGGRIRIAVRGSNQSVTLRSDDGNGQISLRKR